MVAGAKKIKIGRALRSAARLPVRVASGRGSGRDVFAPIPGEPPIVLLRVQVLACAELPVKDRNGTSDPYVYPELYPMHSNSRSPQSCFNVVAYFHHLLYDKTMHALRFVVVSLLNKRQQTPVQKKTLNPVYPAKDATFDFPLFLSLADRLGVVELVVWDKDMLMKKDYLGEAGLPLDRWFSNGVFGFEDPANEVRCVCLIHRFQPIFWMLVRDEIGDVRCAVGCVCCCISCGRTRQ